VANSNVASIRVLEKCGFVRAGEHAATTGSRSSSWSCGHEDRPELRA
jgi:RimJ/RimL family protein N-acetyltransferase